MGQVQTSHQNIEANVERPRPNRGLSVCSDIGYEQAIYRHSIREEQTNVKLFSTCSGHPLRAASLTPTRLPM